MKNIVKKVITVGCAGVGFFAMLGLGGCNEPEPELEIPPRRVEIDADQIDTGAGSIEDTYVVYDGALHKGSVYYFCANPVLTIYLDCQEEPKFVKDIVKPSIDEHQNKCEVCFGLER